MLTDSASIRVLAFHLAITARVQASAHLPNSTVAGETILTTINSRCNHTSDITASNMDFEDFEKMAQLYVDLKALSARAEEVSNEIFNLIHEKKASLEGLRKCQKNLDLLESQVEMINAWVEVNYSATSTPRLKNVLDANIEWVNKLPTTLEGIADKIEAVLTVKVSRTSSFAQLTYH